MVDDTIAAAAAGRFDGEGGSQKAEIHGRDVWLLLIGWQDNCVRHQQAGRQEAQVHGDLVPSARGVGVGIDACHTTLLRPSCNGHELRLAVTGPIEQQAKRQFAILQGGTGGCDILRSDLQEGETASLRLRVQQGDKVSVVFPVPGNAKVVFHDRVGLGAEHDAVPPLVIGSL